MDWGQNALSNGDWGVDLALLSPEAVSFVLYMPPAPSADLLVISLVALSGHLQ